MTPELTLIITILGAVGTVFGIYNIIHNANANKNKEDKTDKFELGQFMGEIKSELQNIKESITDLRSDYTTIQEEAHKNRNYTDQKMQEHIEKYHTKKD